MQQQDQHRMEDIAEDYVNELIDRNVVQVVKTSTNGKVRECRLYDLVRELCIRKGKEENFLKTDMITESLLSSTKSRRYGVYSDFDRYAASTPHLRTLLFFKLDSGSFGMPQVHFISKCFKLLRVLDFEGIEIGSLPSSFGKLTHLRYLGLRGTGLETLPTSIGNLRSLQTMDTSCLK